MTFGWFFIFQVFSLQLGLQTFPNLLSSELFPNDARREAWINNTWIGGTMCLSDRTHSIQPTFYNSIVQSLFG
jgi:hypothetical protein